MSQSYRSSKMINLTTMFQYHITGAIMGAIMRGAESDQAHLIVSLTALSDIAEDATDDILNILEEKTSRYYESSKSEDAASRG